MARTVPTKVFNIGHVRETVRTVGWPTEGLRITAGTSVRIAGRSQLVGNAGIQRSARLRGTQVYTATMGRKEGRRTAALSCYDQKFCGSFDN